MIYLFLVFLGLDLTFGWLDATHSANGIAKGLFVEGNQFVQWIYGKRPTLKQLVIFNVSQAALCSVAACFDHMAPGDVIEHPLMMLSASMCAADFLHHVKGYYEARWKFGA